MTTQKTTKKKTSKATKTAKKMDLKRIFVLDTNVLLHDAKSIFSFKGVMVGIPFAVLEELDQLKKEQNELGMNARNVIRLLDSLKREGSLKEGVSISNEISEEIKGESFLKVLPTPQENKVEFCSKTVDNIIIQTIVELKNNGYKATLITKDINLRVKCDFLDIPAEDYEKDAITYEEYYKGWTSLKLSSTEIKKANVKKLSDIVDVEGLCINEFVALESQHNEWTYRLFRFLGGNNFKEVSQENFWQNFGPRNIQQAMALDLLLDDSIKFISLLGPAGTGKTFLAILAGLFKTTKEHFYRKFLITRPIVALGADVGYLPGNLQEKLFNWMQPVYDNIEIIFSELNHREINKQSNKTKHPKKDNKSHKKQLDIFSEINNLKTKGLLSLEAITYMRGRSIANQFVFIDEAQNLTPHEIKTIVTRAGEGTKVIIAGDPYQIDSPYMDFISNGLTVTSEKFKEQPLFGTVFLETSERSELAKVASEIL
jgi:PhoH-like ATPase